MWRLKDVIVIVLGIAALLGLLYWSVTNRQKPRKEKELYVQRYGKRISDEWVKFFADSITGINGGELRGIVFVNEKCTWQSIRMSSMRGIECWIDTIVFTHKPYKKFWDVSRVLIGLRTYSRQEQPELPISLAVFLQKHQLGFDSGQWGAMLIKNRGHFTAESIDPLVREFLALEF